MGMKRTLMLGLLGLGAVSATASAQGRDNSFKWYIGAQAGVLGFETPSQTRAWVPTVGGALLIHAKRTGLLIGVDEALGSNELSGFADNSAVSSAGIREVSFSRIRKYSAVLTGYPIRGTAEPYLGLGFGLLQVLNPQPGGVFTNPVQASAAKFQADQRSTDGFMTFVAGVQFHLAGRVLGFGQYQLTSGAAGGQLLRGPSHGVNGGFRFSLGGAKEGIRGGGY
jgi:hypothetical protein